MAWPISELQPGIRRLRSHARAASGRVAAVAAFATVAVVAAGCSASAAAPPTPGGRVTVPDTISDLPSGEVERRLSGLLEPGQPIDSGVAAPLPEPTATPEPTISIEDILEALNSGQGGPGEIVISVSPSMSQGLTNPVLRIKTPPSNGSALVLSESQVLFVPDPGFTGGDSFEYELLDGETPVFSAIVEMRPPAAATRTTEAGQ